MTVDIYAAYNNAVQLGLACDTTLYTLDQERFALVREIMAPITAYYSSRPGQIHKDWWATVDTIAVIHTAVKDAGIGYMGRCFQIVHHPAKATRFMDFYDNPFSNMIPLDGWVQAHDLVHRVSAYVEGLLHCPTAGLERVYAIDWEKETCIQDRTASKQAIEFLLVGDLSRARMQERFPNLHALMQRHDWSYQYADRPVDGAWEMRRQIDVDIRTLSIPDAVAM